MKPPSKSPVATAAPFIALAALLAAGCADRPTLVPNPDPNLRKTRSELSADAAQRFPYKANAPRSFEPRARAQVGYVVNRLEIVNFSGQDWQDVEVWVNGRYVCHVPRMEDRQLKEVHFPMLYDEDGRTFPTDNRRQRVEKVELYRDGTLYSIVCRPRDW